MTMQSPLAFMKHAFTKKFNGAGWQESPHARERRKRRRQIQRASRKRNRA